MKSGILNLKCPIKQVNGFVAIAYHLNPKIQEMDLEDVIELEEKEYQRYHKRIG